MKVALVTGASSGIGAATARLLSSSGFRVIGTSRRVQPGLVQLDPRDESAVASFAQDTGTIDLLVNNIGGGIAGAVEETSVREASEVFEANLWSAMRITQAFLPGMRARGSGRIVVMSFAPDLIGIPFRGVYCASKFALESVFDAMRHELADTGVQVSIVKPAGVATPAADHVPHAAANLEVYRTARAHVTRLFDGAMRNGIPPEHVAKAILKAATARQARVRYLVGAPARAIWTAQHIAPPALVNYILRRLVKPV
ncbi:oxidoreductase [Nonomuraea antimicrobica]|uniref:Oxidoreductase n=1 Tax=Nonomuraea antimicrobica TaxID=561173 RepID=A0ABP7BAQ3_9ACTN